MIRAGQVVDLTDTLGDAASQFSKPVLDAMTLGGQDLRDPADRRHADDLLPQVGPGEGRRGAAADVRRPRRGGQGRHDQGHEAASSPATTPASAVLASMLVWAAGKEQLNADQTGIGFDDADGYAAFAAYRDLVTSGALLRSASADWFDAAPLTNGETAMQWTGLWTLPDVQDKLGDDFGVAALPRRRRRRPPGRALRLVRLDRHGQGQGPGGGQGLRQVAVGRLRGRPGRLLQLLRRAHPGQAGAGARRRPRSRRARGPRRRRSSTSWATRRASCGRPRRRTRSRRRSPA